MDGRAFRAAQPPIRSRVSPGGPDDCGVTGGRRAYRGSRLPKPLDFDAFGAVRALFKVGSRPEANRSFSLYQSRSTRLFP
jgi:hypothetical protein